MRIRLANRAGSIATYTATFKRYGGRPGHNGATIKTLLLVDILDARGNRVTGHQWFTTCRTWERFNMVTGQRLQFVASVKRYRKGYRGRLEDYEEQDHGPRTDFKLAWPRDVRLVKLGAMFAEPDQDQPLLL